MKPDHLKALEMLGKIGALGLSLQRLKVDDAVRLLRKSNSILFEWLAAKFQSAE